MMLRSPIPPERTSSRSPVPPRPSFDDELERPGSSGSDASSVASNVTTVSAIQNSLNDFGAAPGTSSPRIPRTSSIAAVGINGTTENSSRRPSASSLMPQNEMTSRKTSGRVVPPDLSRHRPRHHSQGFFEPSLPTASLSDVTLSASRIAAQTAMQQQSSTVQQPSKRLPGNSQAPDEGVKGRRGGSISPPLPPPQPVLAASGAGATSGQAYQNGVVGGNALAATTAANVVFPRGPAGDQAQPEREQKQKGDKPKMKLFSKPKHIGISRDKDSYGKDKAMPSPSKMGFPGSSGLSRIVSGSSDALPTNNSSMYSLSNASVSTVVPADRQTASEKEKDKDKAHKHHFLSRQKLKLKDRDDHYSLPLSSASSNSKPSDPNAPQSLYSFTPASPSAGSTTFSKAVGGLDLLHGGRALREKKKEEKLREEIEQDLVVNGVTPAVFPGPSSLGNSTGILPEAALRETLSGFGLHNMTPDDAWDFLKAKLLVIFDGEDVRIAIEDLNKLVLIHIQRCVQKRTPTAIVDDLRELLETGCASLNHTLNGVPDEKLVPHLVQIWLLVFGTILPFIQAVFLPLDLEFRGAGSVMNLREAKDFWNSVPTGKDFENELEVRHLVLVAFRDMVILKRYEGLKATFSRLSLDSINVGSSAINITTKSSSNSGRPATAASLDAGSGSYNSQSSTLLNAAGSYSSDSMSNRSRAASNTSSNPDQLIFQSFSSPSQRATIIHRASHAAADTSQLITETVGRMLQCLSVLASVQTGDQAQEKIETLSKALKHNWLGRGRTGRDRRGFVGAKIRPTITTHTNSDESTNNPRNGDLGWPMRDGRQEVSAM